MEPFISAAKDINVEEIMASIRKKIQDKKDAGLLKQREIDEIAEMELQPLPDFLEIPNTYEPHLYPNFGQYTAVPTPSAEEIQRAELDRKPKRPFFSQPMARTAPGEEEPGGLTNAPPAKFTPIPIPADLETQETGLAKKLLKKIRSLLNPLIRFMNRPMYLELQTAIIRLQNSNAEIIASNAIVANELNAALEEQQKTIVELQTANVEIKAAIFELYELFELRPALFKLKTALVDAQNQLLKHIPVVLQSSEYIKLLHNSSNNIIVEASKLKTEEELLKTKIKILEDKMEFLENRERALEKKLSPS
jgi:hypothetical protein